MVAKHPEKFGISLLETKDADVRRTVAYRVEGETEQRLTLTEEADASFGDDGGVFPEVLFRPWAGGTDSLHTMIYFDKYGRHFFKNTSLRQVVEVNEITDDEIRKLSVAVNGNIVECSLDLGEIVKNRRSFPIYIRNRVSIPAEPTLSAYKEWAKSMPVAVSVDEGNYWIVLEDKCGKLNKLVYKLLMSAGRNTVPVADILARTPEALRQRVFAYLVELESNGFISFKDGDRVIKKVARTDQGAAKSPRFRPLPLWKMPAIREEGSKPTVSETEGDSAQFTILRA
jgi:hypothetical protein